MPSRRATFTSTCTAPRTRTANSGRNSSRRNSSGTRILAPARYGAMLKPPGKEQIDACRACPLYARATQAVPGEGPRNASMMLVGEQPGDGEDLAGHPFVGPAGQLLRQIMAN